MLKFFQGATRLALLAGALAATGVAQARSSLEFERNTFAFANETVFAYRDGHPSLRSGSTELYARRCFVMSRAVIQFRKFARFDPSLPPLGDASLAERIRAVTRRAPWRETLENADRIVIPGVADLRTLSRTRTRVVQQNLGLGWPTYFRPGNWRVLLPKFPGQQATTKSRLDQMLAQSELFVAYLTTMPDNLNINHAVLVLARQDEDGANTSYTVYDPNHAEGPRTLYWSARDSTFWYPADETFVGGRVYVWQVYGGPLQ